MRFARVVAFAFAVAVAASPLPAAAITTEVVDIPTRATTVRILLLRPDAPVAHVVSLAGGNGLLAIRDDGTIGAIGSPGKGCSPVIRNRQEIAGHGYSVALVDAAGDGYIFAYDDLVAIVGYLQSRDPVPTWVMGTSNSTEAAVDLLGRIPLPGGLGGALFAPGAFDAAQAAKITAPTLLVTHPLDTLSRAGVLATAMTAAPTVAIAALSGGNPTGCGYHQFGGLDGPFTAAVFAFIDQHNPTLKFVPLAQAAAASAVEFYHAQLDHYFVTHIAGEIALLDAGTTIKGWARTGESFKVNVGAQAATSPVCRYYIPPGKGDSHFYGRGTAECAATGAANPSFVNEDPQFFHVTLPVAGACPAGTVAVYRVFSNRGDANHRYMVSRALRDQMVGKGWLAEGDGDDRVVMCAPA